jgi:FKBP-type peptidyl-prolyl cis-trans isomerase SlpA
MSDVSDLLSANLHIASEANVHLNTEGGKPAINENAFVTLHYRIVMAESSEVLVSTFEDKPATLQMGQGQLAEGLERCLLGLQVGQRCVFELAPAQAYGERQDALLRYVSKQTLKANMQEDTEFDAGDFVEFPAPNGGRFAGTVVREEADAVLFDFNHPLAGRPLKFEVQIIGVL